MKEKLVNKNDILALGWALSYTCCLDIRAQMSVKYPGGSVQSSKHLVWLGGEGIRS